MIVVTGATGNVGRPLVRMLAEAGETVTAVSRNPPLEPDGVRHLRADLSDPGSLRPALEGAEAVFVLVPGAGADPHGVLDAVKAGGARRIVLLSSQGAGTRPESPSHAPLRAFEDAVRGSGLDWTALRPGGFHSNALAWADTVRAHRAVAAPFGDVALPSVDPADIAEVAAAALRDTRHIGRTYVLTGPAATTPRERARAIGDALGEPVRFTEQTREQARARLLAFMPEPVVEGTLDIMGHPSPDERLVSPDVELVLGRAPRPFAGWAHRFVAAFR
ncbi:SDR family oxidoreductase [Sphaerisporangium aureirubrum]|uniref:SDR family oxidoreductase n=1 Tax=Sphaerisporangium aureirubrum TaxID=1544736 RepID=A0ABW1NQL1_9ACTN